MEAVTKRFVAVDFTPIAGKFGSGRWRSFSRHGKCGGFRRYQRASGLALPAEVSPFIALASIRKNAHTSDPTRCVLPQIQPAAILLAVHRGRVGQIRFGRWTDLRGSARCRERYAEQHKQGENHFAVHFDLHLE